MEVTHSARELSLEFVELLSFLHAEPKKLIESAQMRVLGYAVCVLAHLLQHAFDVIISSFVLQVLSLLLAFSLKFSLCFVLSPLTQGL